MTDMRHQHWWPQQPCFMLRAGGHAGHARVSGKAQAVIDPLKAPGHCVKTSSVPWPSTRRLPQPSTCALRPPFAHSLAQRLQTPQHPSLTAAARRCAQHLSLPLLPPSPAAVTDRPPPGTDGRAHRSSSELLRHAARRGTLTTGHPHAKQAEGRWGEGTPVRRPPSPPQPVPRPRTGAQHRPQQEQEESVDWEDASMLMSTSPTSSDATDAFFDSISEREWFGGLGCAPCSLPAASRHSTPHAHLSRLPVPFHLQR